MADLCHRCEHPESLHGTSDGIPSCRLCTCDGQTLATFDVPTDEQIGASDVVATVFIERRISKIRAEMQACIERKHDGSPACIYCFSRTERIGELEDIL